MWSGSYNYTKRLPKKQGISMNKNKKDEKILVRDDEFILEKDRRNSQESFVKLELDYANETGKCFYRG